MGQYEKLKNAYPGCILFFRLGDFYEMFGEDARYASKELQIVLTARGGRPMCGVPYHSVENYLVKLVKAGKKVAIVEQLEEPSKGKQIVERDVVRVVTPGTLTEDALASNTNNFILSVFPEKGFFGCVMADISTGELIAEVVAEEDFPGFLKSSEKITEVIYPEESPLVSYLGQDVFKAPMEKSFFSEFEGRQRLEELLKVSSVRGFEMDEKCLLCAAAALFDYLSKTKMDVLSSIGSVSRRRCGENLFMDSGTIRNLEITANVSDGSSRNTLFGVLDRTSTAQGARLLKKRLLSPPAKIDAIRRLQSQTAFFIEKNSLRDDVRSALSGVSDIERAASRISITYGRPAEYLKILESLKAAEILRGKIDENIFGKLNTLDELKRTLADALVRKEDGSVEINPAFDPKIKEYSEKYDILVKWLKDFESKERERWGIPKLKVSYNSVFGYYIEITKSNLSKVPSNGEYIRKQTLVSSERFITHELKEKETEILIIKDELQKIQKRTWERLAGAVRSNIGGINELSQMIASIDVARSFAEVAVRGNYVMPEVSEGDEIEIKDARHPVVEKIQAQVFTPNSVFLDRGEKQIMLLTGPNMAGKSTYIRQTALCVIMAQAGAAIPSTSAKIGIADRIFTRIGAGDNLSQGSSTFMVEMNEAANILNNSTKKSLIIIDELGRGTSTYDGISIAWACLEYIAKDKRHSRCLFATHFFELVELEEKFSNIKNFNAAVKEWQGVLHFLHKIEPGPADRSYGIHVARLAGIPDEAVKRAGEILKELEAQQESRLEKTESGQLTFFSSPYGKYKELFERIKALNLDELKPIKALEILDEIKDKLKEEEN